MGLGKTLRKFVVRASLEFDDKSFSKFDKAVSNSARTAKQMSIAIAGASTAVLGFAKVTGRNARDLDNYSRQGL